MIDASCFALAADPAVEYREIGDDKHKVVIVDGFYREPERVAELANTLEFSSAPDLVQQFPGERAEVEADTAHLARAVWHYFGRVGDPSTSHFPFCVSRYRGGRVLEPRQRLPHFDPTLTALVYLNSPDDCAGGTAMYRHRSSGLELIPLTPEASTVQLAQSMGYRVADFQQLGYPVIIERMLFNERFAPAGNRTLNEGNHVWELMTLVEMRFNRLVIYDGRIPHGMWVEPAWFVRTPRVYQLLSLSLDHDSAVVAA